MMWTLYQLLVLILLVIAAPILLVRRWGHYAPTLRARLGVDQGAPKRHPLWIHAVSVGEVEVARTLIRGMGDALDPQDILLTTVTPTGQERARKSLGAVEVDYLPFELGFSIRRFYARHRPERLVLVEGELWPLVLRHAKRHGNKIVMINGRISDRSFPRMRTLRSLLRPLLAPVDHFGVQTRQDRDRLLALGVDEDRITVTGNLKFDAGAPPALPELEQAVRRLAGNRPILVAGSTMAGEDAAILDALEQLEELDPLLVLAPRHPERFADAVDAAANRGFRVRRRSDLEPAPRAQPPNGPCQVLVLDSLGELATAYSWAVGAFVGGTLVRTGGHNPLEPVRCGAPTCVGPSMENFREMAQAFDDADAWQRVEGPEDLAGAWRRWIEQPESAAAQSQRAQALLDSNRGAVARTLALLERHLDLDLRPVRAETPGTAPP